MQTKCFKIKLDIGIAGYVRADHYVAADGMLQFYSSDESERPVAIYTLASVSSVEECRSEANYGLDTHALLHPTAGSPTRS